MRRLARRGMLVLAVGSLLAWQGTSAADVVHLTDGTDLRGDVAFERIVVASQHGEVIVPAISIRAIRALDDGFAVTLVDGTTVSGKLQVEAVELRTGLVLRKIPLGDIRAIEMEASAAEVAASVSASGGFLEVDEMPVDSGVVSVTCPLRIRFRLPDRFSEGTWSSARMRMIECDHLLSIPVVQLHLRKVRGGGARLDVSPSILVRPPQDQLARLRIALDLDGAEAARAANADIDAEEGRMTTKALTLHLSPQQVEQWSSVAHAMLEVELSSVDN